MLSICPNCGHKLPKKLADGIEFCEHCQTTADTSRHNRVMSAAWTAFKHRPESFGGVAEAIGLTDVESILVEAFVVDACYSIDEFRAALKEIGFTK